MRVDQGYHACRDLSCSPPVSDEQIHMRDRQGKTLDREEAEAEQDADAEQGAEDQAREENFGAREDDMLHERVTSR
jgi:hypothetical protein